MSPKAGKSASDSCIQAVIEYESGFSSDFSSQIVRYSAASEQAISCTLKSGVLVSLGEPSDISSKEQVVTQILQENPDQVTYINVRVVSQPSYRKVDSDSVTAGSGETASDASSTDATTGSSTDATSQDASTDASTDASSDAA